MVKKLSVEYWCLGSEPVEARNLGDLVENIRVSEQAGSLKPWLGTTRRTILWSKVIVLKVWSQTSSISLAWDFVGRGSALTPPKAYWIGNSGGVAKQSVFNKPFWWYWHMITFEDHWSKAIVLNSSCSLELSRELQKKKGCHGSSSEIFI